MAALTRVIQKIFASSAGTDQRAKIGSKFAGTPAFTTDPTEMQSFSNYLEGWFSVAIGGAAPTIEDMNALCYLLTYQLAYILQNGVPEWLSTETYYTGDIVFYNGYLFVCSQDTNLNHNPSTANTWWYPYGGKLGSLSGSTVALSGQFDISEIDATSASVIADLNPTDTTVQLWPIGAKKIVKATHTNSNTVSFTASGGYTLDGYTSYPTSLGALESMTIYRSTASKFYII
jgi:hypothetical protein